MQNQLGVGKWLHQRYIFVVIEDLLLLIQNQRIEYSEETSLAQNMVTVS